MEEAYVYTEGFPGVFAALVLVLLGRGSDGLSSTHPVESLLQSLGKLSLVLLAVLSETVHRALPRRDVLFHPISTV